MKQLVWIAIDKEDGEPVISSLNESDLLQKLNEWNGASSKIVENRKMVYDGENTSNLERIIIYQDSLNEEVYTTTYQVWCIELS